MVDRVPVAVVAQRVLELARRHKAGVAVDGAGPAATLVDPLRVVLGDRLVVMTGADAAAAAGELFDRMTATPPSVLFRAHPVFAAAVTGAQRRSYGQRWMWERVPGSGASGAPLVAAGCAVWADVHAPAPVAPFRIL